MKAVRIHEYGGPEVLRYEEAPRPVPGEGDVLVRVHAAGINPVDWKLRAGWLKEKLPYDLPLILGWDLSGVVEEVGPGVTEFSVGEEVYSRPDIQRDGAYAEFVAVRASELARKPKSIGHVEAAGVPLAAITAWQALFESAGLAAGQTVLVHAAAGGVGSFAVQFAKWRGARVVATASAANHALVRDLGADEVIDYRTTRFEEAVREVDMVFDTIGGETQERSWGVLREGGMLVSVISPPSEETARAHGVRQDYIFIGPNAAWLTEIAGLIDAGHVRPLIGEVFPLSEVRKAHELSQTGHARGKIVLKVVE
ncbi:NADP-dependent oxidoreductase [Azospirillum sp. SYSU D00513]|uniref:NADP-dependent oxidoreductase n=1 Tax=Azospirillum sp. SYSU D00513 TaxID=2812561 RepID=UPI001A9668FB|nr:NADP-dependent oxidoreductase [Azospirillum sp. SYSU D00513]